MAKPINVLYVTSESQPYIRVQSLADISYSYVMAMREQGVDIRLFMPRYGVTSERRYQIHYIKRLTDLEIPMGKTSTISSIKSSSMNSPRTKVQAYITTHDEFFSKRKGVYRDFKTLELYPDNPERYLFFCRSVVETLGILDWVPDIVHYNDGETSLVAAFLKILFPEKFQKTKFVLNIHNIEEQVVANKTLFDKTGFKKEHKEYFYHKDKFNFLKSGILFADSIVFSNKLYMEEVLKSDTLSNGLNELIKQKDYHFIPVGMDQYTCDPKKDKQIAYKLEYDIEEFKYNNKANLFLKFDMDYDPSLPLFGLILDVNEYEAIEYFLENAPHIFKDGKAIFFVMARLESRYKNTLKLLSKKYKKSLRVMFTTDMTIHHQLFAGSDFYLSLDNHDPTNLNIYYAIKYGCVPVVDDFYLDKNIVKPFDEKTKKGHSLIFQKEDKNQFFNSIDKAIKIFDDKDTYNKLVENTQQHKFDWEPYAKEYKNLYTKLLKGK